MAGIAWKTRPCRLTYPLAEALAAHSEWCASRPAPRVSAVSTPWSTCWSTSSPVGSMAASSRSMPANASAAAALAAELGSPARESNSVMPSSVALCGS